MSSQGFSFPPPPPPPPQQQNNPTYPSTSQYGQNHHGQRGRSSNGYQRGRGRGYGNRGSRGGHYGAPDISHLPAYPANSPAVGYPPVSYNGFVPQPMPAPTPGISTPSQYPSSRTQNFQHPSNSPAFPLPQPYSQPPAAHVPTYPRRPSYDAGYNNNPSNMPHPAPYSAQTQSSYAPVISPAQRGPTPAQPPVMGPPMRWGFETSAPTGSFNGAQRGHGRGPRSSNPYGHQFSTGDRPSKYPHKRDHASAFGKPHATGPRTTAPPPVPSFGNPLPSKPPTPVDNARKPKKKKRRHNQLGLTPKTEEHESSEEEDDVDEESKLAPGGSIGTTSLQFTYKGRTSTLQSPSDIAAWIEERKKRFPTQARIEEKKKAMEDAKKARAEAFREKKMQRQEAQRQQEEARAQKEQQKESTDPVDAAARARRKAEKLRRKLNREERKVAKAEADAERARLKVEALQKEVSGDGEGEVAEQSIATLEETVPHSPFEGLPGSTSDDEGHTRTNVNPHASNATSVGVGAGPQPEAVPSAAADDPTSQVDISAAHDENAMDLSSEASDSSDWTSSSGSDSSSSGSDSEDDSAPEEVSSRREGPERVPPPPREGKKKLCRHFARTGRCTRGDKCNFSHAMPERGVKGKPTEKKGRKGLLQALLDRQREDEDRRVMEAIAWLGDNGMLDEPAPKETDTKPLGVDGLMPGVHENNV